MAELPSGTVTFLFTDIEGSTRLWEAHPDAMRDALARHDELLRQAIESHGGYVVKTAGDGFLAAFGTAEAGLGAAVGAEGARGGERGGVWSPPLWRSGRSAVSRGGCRSRCGCEWVCTRERRCYVMVTISVLR